MHVSTAVCVACGLGEWTVVPMATTIEANEAIARRVVTDLWGKGNLDLVEELYAEDCVVHEPQRGTVEGREGVKTWVTEVREAFPDTEISLGEVFSCENHACGVWTMTGTHEGEIQPMGIPATGKAVELSGLFIASIEDGVIREEWSMSDGASMMEQLGTFEW